VSCGLSDGLGDERRVGVIESGHGVTQVYGYSFREARGDPQQSGFAARAGEVVGDRCVSFLWT
jgi:hypothetical protein